MNIKSIVDRINENSRLLEEGNLSEIEKDILLADLRALYLLVKGQTPVQQIATPVREVKEATAPIVLERKQEPPIVINPIVVETPVVPVVKAEPVIEAKKEEPAPIIEEAKEQPIVLETKRIHYHEGAPVRGPKQQSSLNEVFVGEERSINTVLGADKKKALNDHISRKDLKSLIDLNKQHILTAELFAGDSHAFNTAVREINDSPTIEAAFEYIKTELLPKYKWNGELQSTKLFDKLIRQKFGV